MNMLLKSASKMNCLNTWFFLVFPTLIAIDAQSRTLPEISLNNDLIIVNVAGMASSQLPPCSTISSPQPNKEIRRRSSSMFHIIFEIIGWVMISNPPPKASSPAEQQVEITSFDGEIESPCNKLTPSTSSILFSTPEGAEPAVSKFRKRSPPPAPPSSSSSTAPSRIGIVSPSLTGTAPWICSRLKSMEIINDYGTPSSLLYASPTAAVPTKPMFEAPHPPIRPSSLKNDQIDQIINGISSTPSDNIVISMITDRKNDPLVS